MEKVYLVHSEYYDCEEYTYGSMLLGIYSSMDSAIVAREQFFKAECEEDSCHKLGYIDNNGNPAVNKFVNGEVVENTTFTIEEWSVQ